MTAKTVASTKAFFMFDHETIPMAHWAYPLMSLPYGDGPGHYRCWPLIRQCFQIRFGITLPFVNVDSDANERAILSAARDFGWRRAEKGPKEDDVVMMRTWDGRRHVGMVIFVNGRLALLHALDPEGVCVDDFDVLQWMGFKDFTYWRRVA